MQDDAYILTVRVDYRDVSDSYALVYYYIDPEDLDLLAVETDTFSTVDDSKMAMTTITITYDERETPEKEPASDIIADQDYTELTLILNPRQDDLVANWYPVANGTQVDFYSEKNYKLYSDEELTQEIDPSGLQTAGDPINLFVVWQ